MQPKLRFQGFNDKWKIFKLKDLAEFKRGPFGSSLKKSLFTKNGKYVIYEQKNVIHKTKKTRYRIDEKLFNDLKKFSLENNDILLSGAGTIGKMYKLKNPFDRGVFNQALIRIRVNQTINSDYFLQYFSSFMGLKILIGKNAGSTIKNLIPIKDFKENNLNLPTLPEQLQIAKLLKTVDALIQMQAQQIQAWQALKQYFLQKLFVQGKHKRPEVRFQGFHDEWEIKPIENLFSERKEKSSIGKLLSVTINDGVIPFTELNRKDNSSDNKKNYKLVRKYDIPYNSMRMWQGASGVSLYDGIVSPAYTVIIPMYQVNPFFYGYMFKTKKLLNIFTKFSQGLTSDTWNLKYHLLSKIKIFYTSLEEQVKIADLLSTLDKLIELHQQKHKHFQALKTYFLQNLFC